jgi:SAM-dependent methyltransferase
MLDGHHGPQDVLAELQVFRVRLRQIVKDLAAELPLRERMNDKKVEGLCAQIDTALRDYLGMMTRINASRIAHEETAPDRAGMIALRREWGVASAQSNLLRVELNQWSLMRDMVRRQVAQRRKRIPLYEKQPSGLAQVQAAASDDVFDWLHAVLNSEQQTEDAYESGCFADIALPNSVFHKHLHAAYRVLLAKGQTDRMRFLDVGCGGGLKVLSALRYFKEADGLDFQQSYVDSACHLLDRAKAKAARAFQADALTFEGYGDYEIIYFYRPIRDNAKIIEMERRIVDLAKPGTLLIAPYCGFAERSKELKCGRVAGQVYMAKTSQRQADQWRRRAEQTGVAVAYAEEKRVPTIWTPLLEASRQSGYDIERYAQPV